MERFANKLNPISTTQSLRPSRQRHLQMEEIRMRQCKFGGLRWSATVSQPDISTRLAQLAATAQPDNYRINDLIKMATEWEMEAISKFFRVHFRKYLAAGRCIASP